jgi:hypothetical protein
MTLIELVLTVVILGIVIGAIGVSFSVFSRTNASTGARLTTSDDEARLNTWLSADVQSIDVAEPISTDPGDAGACADPLAGTNLLLVTLHAADDTPQLVSYRLSGSGDPYTLVRTICDLPGGTARTVTVARNIVAPADAVVRLLPDGAIPPQFVEFDVTSTYNGDGSHIVVSGALRVTSPPSTLPSTTTSPPTTAPPTTTTTTTAAPTCQATSVAPLSLASSGPNARLSSSSSSFTVTVTSPCSGTALSVRFVQNGRSFALSSNTATTRLGSLNGGDRNGFPTGTYTVEIYRSASPTQVVGTFTATVNL